MGRSCPATHGQFRAALVSAANKDSTGLNNNCWGVVVNRQGEVCAVAYSGPSIGSQWLLSRQIAVAKVFTANGLSLDGAPVATAALYSWVLPVVPQGNPATQTGPAQNPLFGLNGGNVLDSEAAYKGRYDRFGSPGDPMIVERVGGTITFGDGLGLYSGRHDRGRRPRPFGRHGLRRPLDCLADQGKPRAGAQARHWLRHDHAGNHGPSALPERHRHPGPDALSEDQPAPRSSVGTRAWGASPRRPHSP